LHDVKPVRVTEVPVALTDIQDVAVLSLYSSRYPVAPVEFQLIVAPLAVTLFAVNPPGVLQFTEHPVVLKMEVLLY
jgi:hypothetical protein